ncbi:DUF4174 domain-containing protein [Pararhodonellum marinum]|uniref:DUF4174 domain-containing protein n=1 Tax=Pararhodonellum marinum TaxID=2755358 RepID=UPI0018904997|nr:DUF4174 domain-containing protein [Pararhodonellum marinum]
MNLFFRLLLLSIFLQGTPNINTLEDMRWEKRIVLYFDPDKRIHPDFLEENVLKGIEERDIAYFIFSDQLYSNVSHQFTKDYQDEIKIKFGKENRLKWVLIGKDGGVKLSKDQLIDFDLIFKTIDQMPMRIQEMKDGKGIEKK